MCRFGFGFTRLPTTFFIVIHYSTSTVASLKCLVADPGSHLFKFLIIDDNLTRVTAKLRFFASFFLQTDVHRRETPQILFVTGGK